MPASFGAMARYFRPDLADELTDEVLDEICGYRSGHGAPSMPALLKLSRLGFEPLWIEDIGQRTLMDLGTPAGYKAFVRDTTPSDAAYEQQMAMTDISAICTHIDEYARRGLPFRNMAGKLRMVQKLLSTRLIKLAIDSTKLLSPEEQPSRPPLPHSVIVVGHGTWRFENGQKSKVLLCHDPKGEAGNIPYRPIPLPKLAAARGAYNNRQQIIGLRPSLNWLEAQAKKQRLKVHSEADLPLRLLTFADTLRDAQHLPRYFATYSSACFEWER